MRIVCGTDFSVRATEASQAAARLAQRFNDVLFLVHVAADAALQKPSSQAQKSQRARLEKQLSAEAERLRDEGAIVKEKVLFGSAHEALVKESKHAGTRLVVISTLGQIAPSRFLVGSVAERTAESSPVPTLVVHDAAAFQRWVEGKPLKVFVGYDYSPTADGALRWVKELARVGPCEVTVGYAANVPEQFQRLGLKAPMPLGQQRPEIQQYLERELKERVAQHLPDPSVQVVCSAGWGRPDADLLEMASQAQAHLVVVGTHQRQGVSRLWLGSVSRSVLRHARMSVVVVPPAGEGSPVPQPLPRVNRVLISTDLSDLSNSAIPHGYAALHGKGRVCLLHVVPGARKAADPSALEHAKKQLRMLVPGEAELQGVETEVEVVENPNPAIAICQAAERFGADVICLTSHGRTGLARTVLGSVAQSVLSQSCRPVLIVRPPRP